MLEAVRDVIRPGLAEATRRWSALSPREKVLALVCGIAIATVVVYMAVTPVLDFRQAALDRQSREFQDLMWMQEHRAEANAQASAPASSKPSDSILSTINAAAKTAGLPLRRIQPEAEGFIVQIDRQPFRKVLRWLDALEARHNVTVVRASVDLHEPGVVNARFSLR